MRFEVLILETGIWWRPDFRVDRKRPQARQCYHGSKWSTGIWPRLFANNWRLGWLSWPFLGHSISLTSPTWYFLKIPYHHCQSMNCIMQMVDNCAHGRNLFLKCAFFCPRYSLSCLLIAYIFCFCWWILMVLPGLWKSWQGDLINYFLAIAGIV